jgi:tetrahydromethanopterin S-methyltransferase subunit A
MLDGPMNKALGEIREGMRLPKCHRCGCMQGALQALSGLPPEHAVPAAAQPELEAWCAQMEPIRYPCLGCERCYPADALNALHEALPGLPLDEPSCGLGDQRPDWPPVPGEYFNLCRGDACTVAVSTLASPELARALADEAPPELCIVGKTETENIGLDKIIRNTVTNPAIRHLILAGREPKGHKSGQTLLALIERGVDESMRVIESEAPHPVLRNVTREEVEAFRSQVTVVDMIGCEDASDVVRKIQEVGKVSGAGGPACGCAKCGDPAPVIEVDLPPVIRAEEPGSVMLDPAGYFVILTLRGNRVLRVEHYDYQNRLLHVVEGRTARSLYWTILRLGWVSELLHAAYLGKELARAEQALETGSPFVQDGATGPWGGQGSLED